MIRGMAAVRRDLAALRKHQAEAGAVVVLLHRHDASPEERAAQMAAFIPPTGCRVILQLPTAAPDAASWEAAAAGELAAVAEERRRRAAAALRVPELADVGLPAAPTT